MVSSEQPAEGQGHQAVCSEGSQAIQGQAGAVQWPRLVLCSPLQPSVAASDLGCVRRGWLPGSGVFHSGRNGSNEPCPEMGGLSLGQGGLAWPLTLGTLHHPEMLL